MSRIKDQYLGDGVYASTDGFAIWLDLRGQDTTTRIALEPAVMSSLLRFAEYCQEQEARELEAPEDRPPDMVIEHRLEITEEATQAMDAEPTTDFIERECNERIDKDRDSGAEQGTKGNG